MSGPGITPENTQVTQEPQGAHELQGTEGTHGVGSASPSLISALGGRENLEDLMEMFAVLNRKVMAEFVEGISKMVDVKITSAFANSQQSVAGIPPTHVQEAAAVGTSQGEEIKYKMRPKLELNDRNEPGETESMNELNTTVRNVYERHLKEWEKWIDQPTEKKLRMIKEVRLHFKNGHELNQSTIRKKLGAAGRNRREYLHSVVKSYDAGECELEKLWKSMSEETEKQIREQKKSKVNRTAQLSQQKKKVYVHHLGAGGVAKFKLLFEKKTGQKATKKDIAKAKEEGIASVLADYNLLADEDEFTSDEEHEEDANEDNEDEEEEDDDTLLIPARPESSSRGGSSQGHPSSFHARKKQKKTVPDSQFGQNLDESEEEEEPRREELRKKIRNDPRPQGRAPRANKKGNPPAVAKAPRKMCNGR